MLLIIKIGLNLMYGFTSSKAFSLIIAEFKKLKNKGINPGLNFGRHSFSWETVLVSVWQD